MAKRKKIISAIIVIIAALAVTLSVLFIAEEANHSCTGADCIVCRQISSCLERLKGACSGVASGAAAPACIFVLLLFIPIFTSDLSDKTLISLKVKLSD